MNAASCNLSDVQSAFNSVTASTTIVSIPAGICDWTGQITWAIPLGGARRSPSSVREVSRLKAAET
jgi:hypothetical protein